MLNYMYFYEYLILKVLDLSCNHIGNLGCKYLAPLLAACTKLAKLYLNHNGISQNGAEDFARAFGDTNRSVTVILTI